jgi:hypothetical protein
MVRNTHAASRRDRKKCRRTRAWLNGEEVTDRCFYADNRRGVVGLYRLDANGHKYVDMARREVAREWRRGKVAIERSA